MQIPNEKGWVIRSACERVWFLPYVAVVQDYKNFIMDYDGLTSEEADEQIGRGDISFWFYDKCLGNDVILKISTS